MKVLLVSSVGGHLTELLQIASAFADCERIWVVNDVSPVLPEEEKGYTIAHAERDWRVVWNLVESLAILAEERPDAVVSTGAGPAVPMAIAARMARIPVVYIEATCAVTRLTLTGQLMRFLACSFYVQWQSLAQKAPWARYVGGLL